MNDEINRLRNQRIAKYLCDNKIKSHLMRKDGIFFNGFIKEIGGDFVIIEDREDGLQLVFFIEIKDLKEYVEVSE